MVQPEPERVAALIASMVDSEWPTTEDDRRAWFASLGLPVDGVADTGFDEHDPHARHFTGPASGDWPATGWRVHRDAFVGVHWFLWADAEETHIRAAAEELRSLLAARWPAVDELTDARGGFTALWQPGQAQVDMYYHTPRPLPGRPPAGDYVVQLHVDHRRRVEAEDAEASARSVGR